MSKIKSMLGLYAFALGAMAYDPLTNKIYREPIEPKESEEERKLKLENMYQTVFIKINGIRYAYRLYIETSVVLPKLLAQNQIVHFYFG